MMKKKRFRGLFFNAVLVLTLISLVPLVFIGIHVTRINSRILQHEIFQKQQTVAARLASVVRSYFTHTTQSFSVFIDLHTDFGGHAFLNQEDLSYLRQRDSSIGFLAALDTAGEQRLSSGEMVRPEGYRALLPDVLRTCISLRKNYLSRAYFVPEQGWLMVMAFPIYETSQKARVTGVLLAEVNLRELADILSQAYPLEMDVFVVTGNDELLAYNGAADSFVSNLSGLWERTLQTIRIQLGNKTTDEVKLADGRRWLVARANLALPNWSVYVTQPANVTAKLMFESTIHSAWDVLRLVLIMLLFILGVSYWVIVPITRPLERLRRAALRLREGDAQIRREDVTIPNNEIGDLAEVFVEMAEVLHVRREELLRAQHQLAESNQDLEKRVEERTRELKEATNELVKKERLAAIGQLAAIISHEIRNPLAVISNAARLIKVSIASPEPRVTKQFGIIEDEIKQANSIISEVLGYARSRDLILNVTEINSYLHDIVLSYPFGNTVKVEEKLEQTAVRVKIDSEEMKQAIRNLLANAVEAMPQGGTLTIGTKAGREVVCIYVADTGVGITQEARQNIFTPFFTTKARGTGLGLAVVGKAVARHHGKIFITSKPGQGSCFQIYLKIYHKMGDTVYGTTSENLSSR